MCRTSSILVLGSPPSSLCRECRLRVTSLRLYRSAAGLDRSTTRSGQCGSDAMGQLPTFELSESLTRRGHASNDRPMLCAAIHLSAPSEIDNCRGPASVEARHRKEPETGPALRRASPRKSGPLRSDSATGAERIAPKGSGLLAEAGGGFQESSQLARIAQITNHHEPSNWPQCDKGRGYDHAIG